MTIENPARLWAYRWDQSRGAHGHAVGLAADEDREAAELFAARALVAVTAPSEYVRRDLFDAAVQAAKKEGGSCALADLREAVANEHDDAAIDAADRGDEAHVAGLAWVLSLLERRTGRSDPVIVPPRRAPVQGVLVGSSRRGRRSTPSGTITWAEHEEVWRAYASQYGRSQDAERIAARGGFGKQEAERLLGRPLSTWEENR